MFEEIISIDNLPTIDLHGESKLYSELKITEFINDNIKLKNKYVVIIHGKGTGKLKKVVQEKLKNNKYVIDYKIYIYNDGATIVKLNTL